jgi:hypothetical protein
MTTRLTHYTAEGLSSGVRDPDKGFGLYAIRPIRAGEVLCIWGGDVLDRSALDLRTEAHRMHSVQIDDTLYMVPYGDAEPADFVNHSCTPNAGIKGQVVVVAMREIAEGEEVCFDYAMTDSSDYDEFQCRCGAPDCRGVVTGRDWMRPDLQRRYDGWFSWYLQRKIAALRAAQAAGEPG